MLSSSTVLTRPSAKCSVASRAASRPSRKFVCKAAATAWDSWDAYMSRRSAVKQPAAEEQKFFSAIGSAISSAAGSYKGKHAATQSHDSSGYKQSVGVKSVSIPLSNDLHQKLEAIGLSELRAAMGLAEGTPIDVASTSFTTSDINAGILITGCIIQQGSDKIAKIAFVAAETERQASWSRLEGLILHWACTSSLGSAWHMPPQGWKSIMPNKSSDAGGAIQCHFEKKKLAGSQDQNYCLVMEVPLSGVARSGGIVFVLKATEAQNTKWLKDASTDKDFFIDLQSLPFSRI